MKYTYLTGYQKDNHYRHAFNTLANKVFGIDFEIWYQSGYWNEKYIPYTLFNGEMAVANVSANIMDVNVLGEQKRYIQLGTVMTDESSRNLGLCGFLMEKVLTEWNTKCDFIYLFANSTVLDMYPKFGFSRIKEYSCSKTVKYNNKNASIDKLNMDIQVNKDMLYKHIQQSSGYGKISSTINADLVMFYCITILKDNVYHIKSLDVIAIAAFTDKQIRILDVYSKTDIDLDEVIQSLTNPQIEEVVLGFTPKNCDSYSISEISNDDALFIQNGNADLFTANKLMFPLLSHA